LGATAIEYGLLAAGVSVFILVAVFAMGDELNNLFTAVQTKISNAYS
jgi:pilus assembly protein Flp/PilA